MAKKNYTIQYSTQKFYTINVEAESEKEAYEKAEEAWCDYDDYDWEEYETQTCAEIISK